MRHNKTNWPDVVKSLGADPGITTTSTPTVRSRLLAWCRDVEVGHNGGTRADPVVGYYCRGSGFKSFVVRGLPTPEEAVRHALHYLRSEMLGLQVEIRASLAKLGPEAPPAPKLRTTPDYDAAWKHLDAATRLKPKVDPDPMTARMARPTVEWQMEEVMEAVRALLPERS